MIKQPKQYWKRKAAAFVRIFDFSAVTAIVDRSVGAMRKAG
jgi:hypothetical protein